MRVGVLGSGNGGCAVAFDWAAAGHTVAMYDLPEFPANLAAIAQQGGLLAEGELRGFAPIAYAGHDLEPVIGEADLIFVVGPAYSTEPLAAACAPWLRAGQTVVVCPGSCGGAVVFRNAAGLAPDDRRVRVADTSTLPYAVRLMAPGRLKVHLKLKDGVLLAALPSEETAAVVELLRPVYPCLSPAASVLHTALQNANPVIHPAVSLLNAARIEGAATFRFYEDGVTPAVGRLMEAVDRERIAIGAALGLDIIADPVIGVRQGYMTEANYHTGYTEAPGFRGILAQTSLDHRYFHEDVGYGLVFMSSLGQAVGVPTPTMDALITLTSTLMARDYRAEAKRTLAGLGLDGGTLTSSG